ncbi:hypothetical protein HPB49_020190 [Dermacentor silvarum]|uniref:Uncharacterized protein n=1 Tax=Dermacentor silvarum TaxID=543639 RepID=A0ACB8DR92_DERSI|nr:hypothetical protein HPB49_020190 [Dermacentor silvarum]
MVFAHKLLLENHELTHTSRAVDAAVSSAGSLPHHSTGVARWQHSAQEHVNDLSVRQVGQYFPLAENSGGDLCPPENVDIELHICSYCSKSFATRGNLNAHLRIHTGERPFQCHLCPKAFTQKATLVHHVRTHTGERPYQCRFCPMAFARKLPCRYHELRRHPKGAGVP